MSELKPCPFCGSEARIIARGSTEFDVGCSKIDCYVYHGADWYLPKEVVVQLWNTRPAPNAPTEPVIMDILNGIKLSQCGWEGDEDIVTVNDKPIGSTIPMASLHINDWWPPLKREIAKIIAAHFERIGTEEES